MLKLSVYSYGNKLNSRTHNEITENLEVGPLVGVAVCVFKDNKILLGRRKKTPGFNSWQCPGGLLILGESVFDSAHRLVMHKTGIKIHNLLAGPYTNNHFDQSSLHTVSLYVSAEYLHGEINAQNYVQAEDWQWFDIDELPAALFLPLQLLLENNLQWLLTRKI